MREYILKVKDNLKQVDIDKDFIVVDNKRQDYRYKYDNH